MPDDLRPEVPLGDDEVHVWHLRIDPDIPDRAAFLRLLSDDEKARAARFHFEKDRLEYSLTRAALRLTLQAYGVAGASEVGFVYEPKGKPQLAPEHGGCNIQFNISHS